MKDVTLTCDECGDPRAGCRAVECDLRSRDILPGQAERERDEARADLNALCGELATILGPGTSPAGVSRPAYWIGRVGQALAEVERERDEARAGLAALISTHAAAAAPPAGSATDVADGFIQCGTCRRTERWEHANEHWLWWPSTGLSLKGTWQCQTCEAASTADPSTGKQP